MGRIITNTRYIDGDVVKYNEVGFDLIYCMPKEIYYEYPESGKPICEYTDEGFRKKCLKLETCYVIDIRYDKIYWPAKGDWLKRNKKSYRKAENAQAKKNSVYMARFKKKLEKEKQEKEEKQREREAKRLEREAKRKAKEEEKNKNI